MLRSSQARSRLRTRPTHHPVDPQDRRTQGLHPSGKSQGAHPSQRQAHRGTGLADGCLGQSPSHCWVWVEPVDTWPNTPKTHPDPGCGTCLHQSKFSHESTSRMHPGHLRFQPEGELTKIVQGAWPQQSPLSYRDRYDAFPSSRQAQKCRRSPLWSSPHSHPLCTVLWWFGCMGRCLNVY